jgi:hypothetical protein
VEERGTAPSERPCGKLRARELQFARETSLVIVIPQQHRPLANR